MKTTQTSQIDTIAQNQKPQDSRSNSTALHHDTTPIEPTIISTNPSTSTTSTPLLLKIKTPKRQISPSPNLAHRQHKYQHQKKQNHLTFQNL